MVGTEITSAAEHEQLDALERFIYQHSQPVELPVRHIFTPGLYAREMSAPAGSVITSKIHKTRHQFILSRGRLRVWIAGKTVEISAPFHGITEPGTRRAAIVLEDCVWTTFHPTDLTDVEAIEALIIEPRTKHLEGLKRPELGA